MSTQVQKWYSPRVLEILENQNVRMENVNFMFVQCKHLSSDFSTNMTLRKRFKDFENSRTY